MTWFCPTVYSPKTKPLHSVFLAMRSAVIEREATRMVEDPIPNKITDPYTFKPMSGHSKKAHDPPTKIKPEMTIGAEIIIMAW